MSSSQFRIAFIRPKPVPIANTIVAGALKNQFPRAEMEELDVFSSLRKNKVFMLRNVVETLKMFGTGILLKKYNFRDSFMRTPYFMHSAQEWIEKAVRGKKYSFTFQMQSVLNAHTPGTPNFVYTDHTHLANLYYPSFDPSHLYNPRWIELEKGIYRDAAHIFTRSGHVKRSLSEHYQVPPEKATCVYFGANTPGCSTTGDSHYTSKSILFVGNDWERKGGPDLLSAFTLVRKTHPDATLVIAGAHPRTNIPGVTVLGRLSLPEIARLYGNASVFCLPTTIEPAGVVFIEAMSCQLPVVATDVGAVPDFLTSGVNGFMVQVHQPEALAQALITLVADPDMCKKMGQNGRHLVEERYNWDTAAFRMKNRILEVL